MLTPYDRNSLRSKRLTFPDRFVKREQPFIFINVIEQRLVLCEVMVEPVFIDAIDDRKRHRQSLLTILPFLRLLIATA
jgi:hypothetical protein